MKKSILLAISIVIAVTVFTTGCKKVTLDSISWVLLEGSGNYSSTNNTSTIIMHSRVQIIQPNISTDGLTASIVDWELIFQQDGQDVFVIPKTGYKVILGNNIFTDTSSQETEFLWLDIVSLIPITSDIYIGSTPDTIRLRMLITDNKNNDYVIENSAPFQFTRN